MNDEPLIAFQNVSKWYGRYQVLRHVNLAIGRGERVIVCGPSGSGKSTLIRCVNGLEEHQGGTLKVDGDVLSGDRQVLRRVRSKVGMVFQQFNLFPHLTVLENLTLAQVWVQRIDRSRARKRALHQLSRVRIADQADKYPLQLSGGQQQRVAIARALCLSPGILLLDEPTSALDPEMVKEVLDVIGELAREDITMVCVTHEMGFARAAASRVVFMDEGQVVEDATPEDFFTRPATGRAREFLANVVRH